MYDIRLLVTVKHCKFLFNQFSLSGFWIMQNGVVTSIKPQQITFIVPGVKNFDHTEISNFIQKAQDNLVCFSYWSELNRTSLEF